MKTLITTLTLFFVIAINAQEFTGKAIYKTSRKSNFKFGSDNPQITDEMKEQMKKRMQKMNQKTFILEFDKYTSTYKQDVKLDAPKPQIGGNRVMVMSLGGSGAGDVYYKNIKSNRYANQTEIQGKRFLVKDKLEKRDWKLSTETKNIGKYTCYKATFSREVENKSMSIVNGDSKEEVKKEIITTTAWYTTQIPISNGPRNYQGLPGLILEINDGRNTIVCTEIILNPSDKITIQEPKKGKVVSQKKYNKIQEQKTKEMMEKFKGRNGVDLGNGINIKMGG